MVALVVLFGLGVAPEALEDGAEVAGGGRLALAIPDLAAERAAALVVLLGLRIATEFTEDAAEVPGGGRFALAIPRLHPLA